MKTKKQENVLAGLVGAFLGSLIGVACIVGIGQLGYVASISGVIMAVCAIKGYELLGGAISRKGAVIACILTIIMTYFGNRLDFSVSVSRLADTDIFSAFQALDDLLDAGYLDAAAYWGNLAMLYLFTLLGAVPSLLSAFRRATPVSTPPEAAGTWIQAEESGGGPTSQFYPFAGLSWTRAIRLSLSIPLFLPLAVLLSLLMYYPTQYSGSSIFLILATLGSLIGLIVGAVWMSIWLAPFQCMQFVFVRSGREMWRVDLAKLNLIEPYRFSARTRIVRALRWEILTEEEQQRARSAIERAIHSIRAGEVMPDSMLRRIVLYLPDPRLEKETRWVWKISYALDHEIGGRRKQMTIGKVYSGFAPTPDTTPPNGPAPTRWSSLCILLALTVILTAAGWVIGLML